MSKYPLKSKVLWLFKDPIFNGLLLQAFTALGEEWAPQALSRPRSTHIHWNSQIPLRVQQPGVAMGRAVSHTSFWSLVGPLLTSAMFWLLLQCCLLTILSCWQMGLARSCSHSPVLHWAPLLHLSPATQFPTPALLWACKPKSTNWTSNSFLPVAK